MQRTWIETNTEALKSNARALRHALTDGTALMGVVKSNAYGHGIEVAVPALDAHVDWFGVDSLAEAQHVRALSQKPVLILNPLAVDTAEDTVLAGFHQMVSTIEHVWVLAEAASKLHSTAYVHVKFDTGMSRSGVTADDRAALLIALKESGAITIAGVATHFSNADMPDATETIKQADAFSALVAQLRQRHVAPTALVHAANSSATMLYPDTHHDLVRVGIALYGIWPSAHVREASSITLTPALSLRTTIAQIKDIPAGSGVGYGLTDRVTRATRLAVLPIGYADGYDRRFSRTAHVLVRGDKAKVLGNISMNLTTIDITDIPSAHTGDTVTLIGRDGDEEIQVLDLAETAGTISYEVVSRLSHALPRHRT